MHILICCIHLGNFLCRFHRYLVNLHVGRSTMLLLKFTKLTKRVVIKPSDFDVTATANADSDSRAATKKQPAAAGAGMPLSHCSALALPPSDQKRGERPSRVLMCTAGADSTLRVFMVEPDCETLIAVGLDDKTIRTYVVRQDESVIELQRLRGHEDWIRDVSLIRRESTIWLASCSQDSYVRVWTAVVGSAGETAEGTPKQVDFSLETVLAAHDGWVYSVCWGETGGEKGPLQLLTSSMDKSIIIWAAPDTSQEHEGNKDDQATNTGGSGTWTEAGRLGEVGGSGMAGFYRAVFARSKNGDEDPPTLSGSRVIVANAYQGGWYAWRYDQEQSMWLQTVVPSGHAAPVTDMDWDPRGRYLLTCSQDQTTRAWAPWRRPRARASSEERSSGDLAGRDAFDGFNEVARPQIHGHDMQCLSCVNSNRFVSGGEEKVLRAFGAPKSFAENLSNISALSKKSLQDYEFAPAGAAGASVPALGLSNKVVQYDAVPDVDDAYIFYHHSMLQTPPTEGHLKQNTLWPELQKLYGHGYEVYAIAAHPCGKLIASSCKASKLEYAAVILWSAETWQEVAVLQAHALTVTQLAFSPCGRWLLSVSRDRTFAVFQKGCFGDDDWPLAFQSTKKTGVHSRIIWCCAWAHDSAFFLTGSRDKKAVLWSIEGELGQDYEADQSILTVTPVVTRECDDSVTAVDFAAGRVMNNRYLLACGLESGKISLLTFDPTTSSLETFHNLDNAHSSTVSRLRFRPAIHASKLSIQDETSGDTLSKDLGGLKVDDSSECDTKFECGRIIDSGDHVLASCSHDWTVRLWRVRV